MLPLFISEYMLGADWCILPCAVSQVIMRLSYTAAAPNDTACMVFFHTCSLQTAYPAIRRVADDKELKQHYVFALLADSIP
jgi:hypothetical protein